MPTVIDSLLVTLGLDVKEYDKGTKDATDSTKKLKQASEKDLKAIEENGKKLAESFSAVKRELIGLLALAVGAHGLKEFLANTITGQANLGRLAQNLGMSARELDAWGASAETVGGTAQGLQSSLQSIEGGFEAFRIGENSPVVQAFRAMGVSITDARGHMRPMKDMLLDIADVLKTKAPQDQIKLAQMLGMDQYTLYLLRQGRSAVEGVYDQMYKLSAVTPDSVKNAQELTAEWAKLKQEIKGTAQEISNDLDPWLLKLTKRLEKVFDKQHDKNGYFQYMIDQFNEMGKAVRFLADGFEDLVNKSSGTWVGKVLRWFGKLNLGEGVDTSIPKTSSASPTQTGALFSSLEKKYGLPAGTLDKVWAIESSRGKNVGPTAAGAAGPFGLMTGTASDYGVSASGRYDTTKSATVAAEYLHDLLSKYHSMKMALSAYNWGPGNLDRYGIGNAPRETQDYWRKYVAMGGSNVSVETNINGPINISTQATDANGIAGGMRDALQKNTILAPATQGLR